MKCLFKKFKILWEIKMSETNNGQITKFRNKLKSFVVNKNTGQTDTQYRELVNILQEFPITETMNRSINSIFLEVKEKDLIGGEYKKQCYGDLKEIVVAREQCALIGQSRKTADNIKIELENRLKEAASSDNWRDCRLVVFEAEVFEKSSNSPLKNGGYEKEIKQMYAKEVIGKIFEDPSQENFTKKLLDELENCRDNVFDNIVEEIKIQAKDKLVKEQYDELIGHLKNKLLSNDLYKSGFTSFTNSDRAIRYLKKSVSENTGAKTILENLNSRLNESNPGQKRINIDTLKNLRSFKILGLTETLEQQKEEAKTMEEQRKEAQEVQELSQQSDETLKADISQRESSKNLLDKTPAGSPGQPGSQSISATPNVNSTTGNDSLSVSGLGTMSSETLQTQALSETTETGIQANDGVNVEKLQEENERLQAELETAKELIKVMGTNYMDAADKFLPLEDKIKELERTINLLKIENSNLKLMSDNKSKSSKNVKYDVNDIRFSTSFLLKDNKDLEAKNKNLIQQSQALKSIIEGQKEQIDILQAQRDKITAQLATSKERNTELEQSMQKLNASGGALYDEGMQLQFEVDGLRQDLTLRDSTIKNQRDEISSLEANKQQLQEENINLKKQLNETIASLEQETQENEKSKEQISNLLEQVKNLETEFQTQLQDARATINSLLDEKSTLTQQLRQAQEQREQVEAELNKTRTQLKVVQEEKRSQEETNSELMNENGKLKTTIAERDTTINAQSNQLKEQDQQIVNLQTQLDSADETIAKQSDALNKAAKDKATAEQIHQQELQDARTTINSLSDEKSTLTQQLQQSHAQEQQLQTKNNQLALEKDELLERLEDALLLKDVVDEQSTTIQNLEIENRGIEQRLNEILPQFERLQKKNESRRLKIEKAKQLIAERDQQIRVLYANNKQLSQSFSQALSENATVKQQNVIQMQHMGEQEKQLQQERGANAAAQAKIDEQSKIILAQQKQLQEQVVLYQQQKQQLQEKEKQLEIQKQQLEAQQKQIAGLEQQLKSSKEKEKQLSSQIASVNNERKELANKGEELQSQIDKLTTAIKEKEGIIASQEKTIGDSNSQLTIKQEEIENQKEELAKLQEEFNKNQQKQEEIETENENLLKEKAELEQKQEQLQGQLKQAQTAQITSQQAQKQTETELNKAQIQLTALQGQVNSLIDKNSTLATQLQQAQDTLQQTKEQKEQLQNENNGLQEQLRQERGANAAAQAKIAEQDEELIEEEKYNLMRAGANAIKLEGEQDKRSVVEAEKEAIQKQLTEALKQLQLKEQQLQEQDQQLQQEREQAKAEQEQLQGQVAGLRTTNEMQTQKIAELEQINIREQENRKQTEAENNNLKERLQEQDQQLQQEREQAKAEQEQFAEVQKQLQQQVVLYQQQKQQLQEQEKQLEIQKQQLEEKQKQIDNLQTQLKSSNEQINELNGKIETATAEKAQLANKGEELKSQIDELTATIKEKEKTINGKNEQIKQNQADIDGLRTDNKNKDEQLVSKQEELAHQKEELAKLREEFNKNQQLQEEKEAENENLLKEKAELEQKQEQLQEELKREQNIKIQQAEQIAKLKNESAHQKDLIASLQGRNENLKSRLENLSKLEEKIANQRQQLKEYEKKIAKQDATIAVQNDQITDLTSDKTNLQGQLRQTEAEKEAQTQAYQQQVEQLEGVIDQKNMELALKEHTLFDKNNEIEIKAQTINKQQKQISSLQDKIQNQAIEDFFENINGTEKPTIETIELKVGNEEFKVELKDEKLATSFKEIFGDEPVEVANIFEKANECVNALEKPENQNKLETLYNILDGLSGDNNNLKNSIGNNANALKELKLFSESLSKKNITLYSKFSGAALKQFSEVGKIRDIIVKGFNIDIGKTTQVGMEVEAQKESIKTEEKEQVVPVDKATNEGAKKNVRVSRQPKVEMISNSYDEAEQTEQIKPDKPVIETTAILNTDKDNLNAQEQMKNSLTKNQTVEQTETYVYYQYMQGDKDIGLETKLTKNEVKDLEFPIELQIEREKATLGEVVAYAKDFLGANMNPENVMKMLNLEGQNISQDKLKIARSLIAEEINKIANTKGNGLTEEQLKERAKGNTGYKKIVDRIAEKTKQLAEMKKKELTSQIAGKMRESAEAGKYAQQELARREKTAKQQGTSSSITNP